MLGIPCFGACEGSSRDAKSNKCHMEYAGPCLGLVRGGACRVISPLFEGCHFGPCELSSRGAKMNNPPMEYAGPGSHPAFFENFRFWCEVLIRSLIYIYSTKNL